MDAWEGVRECKTFGNKPVQFLFMQIGNPIETAPESEDCLYLNIWKRLAARNCLCLSGFTAERTMWEKGAIRPMTERLWQSRVCCLLISTTVWDRSAFMIFRFMTIRLIPTAACRISSRR